MKTTQVVALSVLGALLLALAVYYWVTPAESLAHFMPGYQAGETARHTKHALGALLLAAGCGVLAWFVSGRKSDVLTDEDDTSSTTDESEE